MPRNQTIMQQASTLKFRVYSLPAEDWAGKTLAKGEFGYDTTTPGLKLGDGITVWEELPYLDDALWEEISAVSEAQVIAPASLPTTENRIPQWDSTSKQLKNGLSVDTSQTGLSDSDGALSTSKAILEELNALWEELTGDSKRFGNYVIGYNATDDSLDFTYDP
jgi:hypothetical protein